MIRTSRGFLVSPFTSRFRVSVPRLTVPPPVVTTTPVSSTNWRAVMTPLRTSKSATMQRRSVCLGSLDKSWNRPGTTLTPISSAKDWRIWPAGITTVTRPLDAAAALCTLFPAPVRIARASRAPSIGGPPWALGRTSSMRMSLTERLTVLTGTAWRASMRAVARTVPCGIRKSAGSSRITPSFRLKCSDT